MGEKIRILVAGCGNMGARHARAYQRMDDFEVVGLVSRGPESRSKLSTELGGVPDFGDFFEALETTAPDAVSINTYTDTHVEYAVRSMERGAHVFVEKPLAETVAEARRVVEVAARTGRKVVVGYILRHHPVWERFVEIARTLGKPLVMRINLSQQSSGRQWRVHRNLMESLPPIVDCGVHYVDMMCLMTRAKPLSVHAVGARLSDEIAADCYNYGQLQVVFDDGSVGCYECGWGPMISEEACCVRDVSGPKGCVSIVLKPPEGDSDDTERHTQTNRLRIHHAGLDAEGNFERPDEFVDTSDEPRNAELCEREQAFFLRAIREDLDLSEHLEDAVRSLGIVLAADESVRSGRVVEL